MAISPEPQTPQTHDARTDQTGSADRPPQRSRRRYWLCFLLPTIALALFGLRFFTAYESPGQHLIVLTAPTPQPLPASTGFERADLQILFIGNSHSAPIPRVLQQVFNQERPDLKTHFLATPSFGFLDQHAQNPATLSLLQSRAWDVVVLQAQKYSTTGRYHYSYDGAIQLAELANRQGAAVLMYPEWSRAGHWDEYRRIEKIHQDIAQQTAATVVPVGSLWNAVHDAHPELSLYSADGNHASAVGEYFTASIFFRLLTGAWIGTRSGDAPDQSTRQKLRDVLVGFQAWPAPLRLSIPAAVN